MSDGPTVDGPGAMRIDRLLVYLRFARTRSAAKAMIDGRALRRNRKHVLRPSECAHIGDVLTVMLGKEVRVVELLSLPQRRASPALARLHYRVVEPAHLDHAAQIAIAARPCGADSPPSEPDNPS